MKKAILYGIFLFRQFREMISYYTGKKNSGLTIDDIIRMSKNGELLSGLDKEEKNLWKSRIQTVIDSSDNSLIPRVPNAGKIENGKLIMHNGLRVDPLSYYGLPPLELLIRNKGVHEPQEELVFGKVLESIPQNAVMLELGSYWAFYSMWFYKQVKGAQCYMIEPEYANIRFGMENFRENGMKGHFFQAFIGDKTFITHKGERFTNVDDYVKDQKIDYIHLLHCDIQGFEHKMLQGAKQLFDSEKVGYVFISTHSNKLHDDCLLFLKNYGFTIIAEANLDESFSADGVIAAKSPKIKGIEKVEISKRSVLEKV